MTPAHREPRWAIVLAAILISMMLLRECACVSRPADPATKRREEKVAADFAARVLGATSGARSDKWQSLRTETYKPGEIALELLYATPPSSTAEAKADTERILRGALAILQRDGRKPASEMVMIWVYALQQRKGETGTDRLVTFGKAKYNPLHDAITFDAPQPKG